VLSYQVHWKCLQIGWVLSASPRSGTRTRRSVATVWQHPRGPIRPLLHGSDDREPRRAANSIQNPARAHRPLPLAPASSRSIRIPHSGRATERRRSARSTGCQDLGRGTGHPDIDVVGEPMLGVATTPSAGAGVGTHQSSGRAAKSRLVCLYHAIPDNGFFHLPFISLKALLCVSSPLATTSFRWLSCAFMTSLAVFPWSWKSHGPPNCLHVIVFTRSPSFSWLRIAGRLSATPGCRSGCPRDCVVVYATPTR